MRFKIKKLIGNRRIGILEGFVVLTCLSVLGYIVLVVVTALYQYSLITMESPPQNVFDLIEKNINRLMIATVIPISFTVVFSVLLIIDCLRRSFRSKREKFYWLVLILFGNFVGSLIYYLLVFRKR